MKNKFYIAIVIVVVSIILWLGGIYFMFFEKIQPFSRNYLAAQQAIVVMEDHFVRFDRIVAKSMKRNKEKVAKVRSFMYHDSGNGDEAQYNYILFIENLADKNNLTHEIGSLPEYGDSPASSQVNVSGKFNDIMTFIREIENDKYIIRIEKVDLKGNGNIMSAGLSLLIAVS